MQPSLKRNWYVVYSKRNKEEQAQFHLGLKQVETFFPRLLLPGASPSKSRIVPLFPNYIFVFIDVAAEAHHVIWTPGVHHFVCFSDLPMPLDPAIVKFLQSQTDSQGLIRARSQLKLGQQVEIAGGPFEGLLGIIQDPPDGKGRVKVLLNLMNRQVTVNLGIECLRRNGDAMEPLFQGQISSAS